MRLRALAPGKVNLALFLGPTRDDGRHELVTLLESLSLADELVLETLESAPAMAQDEVVCPGIEGENLVARALAALRKRGWDAAPVRIDVDKRIPVAAGMGGGSADAAAALRMAVELAPGRPEEVMTLAAIARRRRPEPGRPRARARNRCRRRDRALRAARAARCPDRARCRSPSRRPTSTARPTGWDCLGAPTSCKRPTSGASPSSGTARGSRTS